MKTISQKTRRIKKRFVKTKKTPSEQMNVRFFDAKTQGLIEEHYIATLVGFTLGDRLGMPVEGWKQEQIAKENTREDFL